MRDHRPFRLRLLLLLLLGAGLLGNQAHAQLSGTYTIGSGGNYASFTAAVSALTTSGVSGAVTFNVLSGTYSEKITIPAITGASATNTITFDGGTGNAATRVLTFNPTTTFEPTITLNGADYVRFRNLSIRSTNVSYGQCILFTNAADYNEVSNCIVETSTSSTSTNFIPILASSTSSISTTGAHGSFNLIQNNQIIGGYYGIRWNGSSSTDYTLVQGNQFVNNSITGWYYYGMFMSNGGGGLVIKGNSAIQRSTGTFIATAGYAFYATYPNNGYEISSNYGWARNSPIYVLYGNNTWASTTNRGRIFNNMGVAENTTGTVYGMYVNYVRYTDVVYNSVQARGTTATGYGIYTFGETTNYDTKIVNNMISYDGTGTYYHIYISSAGTFSQFDRNVYWKTGTSSIEGWYWGGVNYTTLAALKTAVPTRHQNSFVGNPRWASNTDCHSTSLVAYQAGTPFSGITTDYDGDTRSTTIPSIGADEYVLTNMAYSSSTTTQNNSNPASSGIPNQEVIGIQIVVSGSLNALNATSFALNTTGTTNAADITAAKIYYTGSSPVFATTMLVGSVSNPSGSFTINGSQALEGPGTNYFWLAYDISSSASSGNFIDAQCTGVTVAGTNYAPTVTNPSGNRMILSPLNGIYTINPSGTGSNNFTSFGAAVTRLNQIGVNGPVTFNVAAGTYTEQVVITPILGASATNRITFDGGTGNAATRVVQFNTLGSYDVVWLFNGGDFVTVKNLTLRVTNVSNGIALQFAPGTDGLGSNYNQVMNCTIEVPANTTTSLHVPVVASTIGSISGYANNANYTLIQDCAILNGYYAMRWNGTANTTGYTTNVGNEFLNNSMLDWYYYGPYIYYQGSGFKIKGNTIIQRRTGTFLTTAGYALFGYYMNDAPEVSYNYLWSAYSPLYLLYTNMGYATTSNRAKIFNNMLIADGTSTTYGLYVSYPRFTDVMYNSVYTKTTGTSYGFYNYGDNVTTYDLKAANNYVVHEGAGTWYALYNYWSGSYSQFDYNAFFRLGTGTSNLFWWNYGSNSMSYASLAALQAGVTGFHQNSKWGNPYFISTTNLHSRSHVGYQAGIPVTGITNDIDGDLRSSTAPCIGADEYPAPPPEFDVAVAKVRLNYADNKFARIEGAATHAVDVVVQNVGLSPNPASFTVTYKVGSAPTSIADGVQQVFSPTWNGNTARLTFATPITAQLPSPGITVFARAFWTSDQGAANNTSSDTRKFDIVKVHGQENFNLMAAPNFSDFAGFLDYNWVVNNVNGGNTWRVEPGVGNGGTNALYYPGDGQQGNDWVFTPGAALSAGSSYRIGFNMRSVTGAPQTVEVAFGQSPDPASMTTFATYSNFTNTAFMTAKQLAGNMDPYFNTPNLNTNYFIGFRVASGPGAGGVVIDDIVLDDNPSPPPKIGFGLPGAALSTFIDNPAVKIQVQANYKSPVVITKTYQVATVTNIYGSNGDFLWDVETATPWISITKDVPAPTAQGYNFNPPRPRQYQQFTLALNPAGLAPGVHTGTITFYGILFNDDFPPPSSGLNATNQPLNITVELIVVNTGTKTGPAFEEQTLTNLGPGTFNFNGPATGNPIATVEVTSGFIPSMTIRVYPNQLPPNITRMMYVKRYWQITHTGTAWTANITFPYADQEAAMVLDRYQLRGVRQAVLRGAWEDPIAGTSSASDPATNTVKVFDLNETNSGGNIALAQPYMYAKRGELPTSFGLEQNFPNPFNPSTTVSFAVAEERAVRIVVYNSLGMEVGELVNDVLPAGRYSVEFDASALPSGTYLYRMIAGDHVQTMQMVLSK